MVGRETWYYLHHGCRNIRNIIFVWKLLQLFIWIVSHTELSRSTLWSLQHIQSWYRMTVLQLLYDKLVIVFRWHWCFCPPASWSLLLSLTAYSIRFIILGMSFFFNHWWWRCFQCGKRVADWVIASLCHGCSRGMIEASLEEVTDCSGSSSDDCPVRKKIFKRGKSSYWLPALAAPRSQLVKMSLKTFANFYWNQLSPLTAPVRDKLTGWS